MGRRNTFDIILLGMLVIVAVSGLLFFQSAHPSAAAASAFALQIKGNISDFEGNSIGYGPFVALLEDGTVVGRGWTRSTSYELNLSEGWDSEQTISIAIGNSAKEFMDCTRLDVDAIKGSPDRTVLITCAMRCAQHGAVIFCLPPKDDSIMKFEG